VCRHHNHFRERRDQFRAAATQFLHALERKFFDDSRSSRGKFHEDDSMVRMAMQPPQQPHAREAVDAFDNGVVSHKEAAHEMLDGSGVSLRHSFYSKKKLKLFGLQASGTRGLIAFREKKANAVTELCEQLKVTFCKPRSHLEQLYR
jgi:hypothetical protein